MLYVYYIVYLFIFQFNSLQLLINYDIENNNFARYNVVYIQHYNIQICIDLGNLKIQIQ